MLVVLEGIDGSGKTTVLRMVASALRREGRRVVVTAEPTRTWVGRQVRAGIASRLDPLALAFLFLADRARHVHTFDGRSRGEIVLCDRYRDSTTAYQAAALADRLPRALEHFRRLQDDLFPAPDLAILLDVPAALGVARIRGRAAKEPFERTRFLRRVRSNYLRLARGGRLVVVDATGPAPAVAAKVLGLVRAAARGAR